MQLNRQTLKLEARQALGAARPHPLLVTFLFVLLTTGLSALVSAIISNPIALFSHLTEQGLTVDWALWVMFSDIGSTGLFLHILLAVFGLVLSFGYSRWALTASRREKAAVSDLVSGFSMVGKVLFLELLVAFFSVLWAVFLFMAGQLLMLVLFWIPLLNILAVFALLFGGLAFYLTRVLRYSMATYCLLDEPDLSAFQALRRSIQLMQGHVGSFFFLQLSFAGWYLLTALFGMAASAAALSLPAGGILALIILLASLPLDLWLRAYTTFTWCRFYDRLTQSQSYKPPFEL